MFHHNLIILDKLNNMYNFITIVLSYQCNTHVIICNNVPQTINSIFYSAFVPMCVWKMLDTSWDDVTQEDSEIEFEIWPLPHNRSICSALINHWQETQGAADRHPWWLWCSVTRRRAAGSRTATCRRPWLPRCSALPFPSVPPPSVDLDQQCDLVKKMMAVGPPACACRSTLDDKAFASRFSFLVGGDNHNFILKLKSRVILVITKFLFRIRTHTNTHISTNQQKEFGIFII